MSTMLQLADRLLAFVRNLQTLQQNRQALRYLKKLASLDDLPSEVALEVQARLAEVRLERKQYRRARGHLTAALLYRPECAGYHFMMATALAKGARPDLARALGHYRRAVEIEPERAGWLAAFGVCCLRLKQIEEGLGALCRAVQLAPNDPVIVRKLVRGLSLADREEEARQVLLAARFRNPRDGRFEKLWHDFRYRHLIRQELRRLRQQGDGPTLLPFVGADAPVRHDRPAFREDEAAPLPGPHSPRPMRPGERKHG